MDFYRDIPTRRQVMASNKRKELADWVRELLINIHHSSSRDTKIKQLTELNYKQAGRLMTLEFYLTMIKSRLDTEMLKLVAGTDLEEEDTLPQPRLKTKGSGPRSGDYLSPMKCGTEFLVRGTNNYAWLLNEFMHAGKKEGNVLLIPHGELNNPKGWVWVDPSLFCVHFELRAILKIPEDE